MKVVETWMKMEDMVFFWPNRLLSMAEVLFKCLFMIYVAVGLK